VKFKISNRNLIILFFFWGIAGGVIFFPIQLDDKYTCLYHRFMDGEHPVREFTTKNALLMHEQHPTGDHDHNVHSQMLLERYLLYYAIFWWGCIGLIVYTIYSVKNPDGNKTNFKNNRDNIC